MHDLSAEFQNADFPSPADGEMLELGFLRLRESLSDDDNKHLIEGVETLTENPTVHELLSALFGNSPYLTQICISHPDFILELLLKGPTKTVLSTIENIQSIDFNQINQADIMATLRNAKHKIALAIGVADLGKLWSLQQITQSLSQFADASLEAALSFVLKQAAKNGLIELEHPDQPTLDSGFIVLGMGKLGSFELNYSSDIDLIVLFDPDKFITSDPATLQKKCVRMTRELVKIMEERTSQGYVFRTDLRLRPDPGATPIAVSMPAAEVYYESQGQNWERAAMIKARPVAGDITGGYAFLKWLTPFVWRKNLDFAAIRDIHSIKRQINTHRGGQKIAVEGHNIKLGRGGIREIEFYAQTQQLIWGGRQPALRTPSTVNALNALVDNGHVERQTADDLIEAYGFLRQSEHRLQMINDEQTQTLPDHQAGIDNLGTFMGYKELNGFAAELVKQLRAVEDHYADLFEETQALSADGDIAGNLVFTGSDSDPDTLDTIEKYGFQNPETVDAAIRGWHHGRYRAMRSTRAREMLTELTPALLKVFGETPDPDATFIKFDEFLAGLPAGVQLFSMLYSNTQLLELLAGIMGEAPRLAELLSRRPSLFDGVLASEFLNPPAPYEEQVDHLNKILLAVDYFEEKLDAARHWANERKFQIGLQSMRGKLSPPKAARALSHIAEAVLECMFPVVKEEFVKIHGDIPGSHFCTVALGKLGSREMTPTSDLDLVFLYETRDDDSSSDGSKPLAQTQYFARLGQRFISALSAPTAEGVLYEVDMRLRPSGNSGPIACSLDAFKLYHQEQAWTWERMAMTRARAIGTDSLFNNKTNDVIHSLLSASSDPITLRQDVATMRIRMDKEHHTDIIWSIKYLRGGLVDVEFIIQYLSLLYAQEKPEVLAPNMWKACKQLLQHGYLSETNAGTLLRALDLWQALQSRLHLSLITDAPPKTTKAMPLALQNKLIQLGGAHSIDEIESLIQNTAKDVYTLFVEIVGEPDILNEDLPAFPN